MFLSSTLNTLIPHGSVASSRIILNLELINSLLVKASSKSIAPITFLSVVAVKFASAWIGFSTPYEYNFASVI